jgi:RNA polymerase sigma factor for flagellar operon FliA
VRLGGIVQEKLSGLLNRRPQPFAPPEQRKLHRVPYCISMAREGPMAHDWLKFFAMNVTSIENVASYECDTLESRLHSSPSSLTSSERVRNGLIEEYLPLVRTVLGRVQRNLPSHVDIDDLHSAGVAGLIGATERFDPAQAATFVGYACVRIRGAILDELRRSDSCTRRSRTRGRQLQAAVLEIEQAMGRAPTDDELSGKLGISPAELRKWRNAAKPVRIVSLDAEAPSDDTGNPLHELIADDTQEDVRETLQRDELKELMAQQIAALPNLPKKVLAMYYFEGMRFGEIAEVFDLTESRICQIHRETVTKLRKSMRAA